MNISRSTTSKSNPIISMGYILKGFNYLTKSGLKRYVIVPLIINIVLFSIAITTGFYVVGYLTHLLPSWLRWLYWLFLIIYFFSSMIILFYTFTILANLIGAPFNGLLSEKVQTILLGQKSNHDEGFKDAIKDSPRALKREWDKIKYYLPRAIILLILFFIPGINLIASVLWFILGCWMMAIQYIDYPMDNCRKTFKETHQFMRSHWFSQLGFGLGVTIATMIPVVNFFVMPSAVIGATLMYHDLIESSGED